MSDEQFFLRTCSCVVPLPWRKDPTRYILSALRATPTQLPQTHKAALQCVQNYGSIHATLLKLCFENARPHLTESWLSPASECTIETRNEHS